MILQLLNILFEKFIGKLPDEKRADYRKRFNELLGEVVKSAAEGAAKGLVEGARHDS